MADTKLTAQQRAQLFGANTRQHRQMLNTQTGAAGQSMTFTVPKTRLLQAISLHVKTEFNLKNNQAVTIPEYETGVSTLAYRVLRNVFIDYNNGFRPVRGSAEELAKLNMARINPRILCPRSETLYNEYGRTMCNLYDVDGKATSKYAIKSTTAQKFTADFVLEIPLTLNDRDPVGLILAQSQESLININIDVETNAGFINDGLKHTYPNLSAEITSVKVTPMLTTFSIPSSQDCFPDLSVLKIVDARTETYNGSGSNLVKLPVGMIYRKLVLDFTDENGVELDDSAITSNIELIFNGADIPYAISAEHLRYLNTSQLGYELPKGLYLFDFSNQGIPNLGGSRDYIDTERITEFNLRFTTAGRGKVDVISEKISRLVG